MVPPAWRAAFPIKPATGAVDAICQAWAELSAWPRPEFNPRTKEPALTKRLKIYVESHTARDHGLLGMWAAEDIIGTIVPETGKLDEERRTDIVYGWNDDSQQLKLVFEFKRLGKGSRYRSRYLGEDGLARFVTGIYGRGQPVAAMVGILLDPEPDVVPPIRRALTHARRVAQLNLRMVDGRPWVRPSRLFRVADFDTEHDRETEDEDAEDPIAIAHIFLAFGYPPRMRQPTTSPSG